VARVTPALLRARWLRTERQDWRLEDAPFPALRRREWLQSVTRFMINADSNLQLKGFHLRFWQMVRVAHSDTPRGTIFAAGETERAIFRTCSHWFIDPEFRPLQG